MVPPHQRPGLFLRKWQLADEPVHPPAWSPPEPDAPGQVLFNVEVASISELVALCSPAKGALGVTLKTPQGRTGWRWIALHGAGYNAGTGKIQESLLLRMDRGDDRCALFLWFREVPDPVLMEAITDEWIPGTASPSGWWWLPAVLALLPGPTWEKVLTTTWTAGASGRPDDIPRAMGSAAVQQEVQDR